ncbi:MAG: DUF3291 domain-containing protein [Proteobacteria bacterium]|nr:DUF3291 domain-containing protein [Pseudomonadota bacterium]
MHLAQYNVARFKGDKNGPGMADFHANLDRINALGDRMPGFVWRLKSAEGDNAPVLIVPGAEDVAANLTVWESVEALENYVWNTVHAKIYARKHEWFEASAQPYLVMWWIEPGHIPTIAEAEARLAHLIANGPSDHAFGWESAPAARLWREKRCA